MHSKDSTPSQQGTKKKKRMKILSGHPIIMLLLSLAPLLAMYVLYILKKYIDYVVTSGVKLDHWARDSLYEKYVLEFILKEDVHTALERSVKTMMEWAEDKSAPWNHYFYHVSTNRAVWDIKDGKVSPWLMLNCKSGKEMLSKFTDEQLEMVYHVINPQHWAMRFKRLPNDMQLVKDIAKESKL